MSIATVLAVSPAVDQFAECLRSHFENQLNQGITGDLQYCPKQLEEQLRHV